MRITFLLATLVLGLMGCRPPVPTVTGPIACPAERVASLRVLYQQLYNQPDSLWSEPDFYAQLDTATLLACADSVAAIYLDSLGGELLYKKHFAAARLCDELALRQRLQWLAPDALDVLRMEHNIGLTYLREDAVTLALQHLQAAAAVRSPATLPKLYFHSLVEIGQILLQLQELNAAENSLREAFNVVFHEDPQQQVAWRLPVLCQSYSSCQRQRRNFQHAIELAQLGLGAHPDDYIRANLQLNLGNAWQDSLNSLPLGAAAARQNTREQATKATLAALNLYRQLGYFENAHRATLNLGELYRRAGQPAQAAQTLSTAIAERSVEGGDLLLAELHLNRGEAQADLSQHQLALADYDTALYLLVPAYRLGSTELPDFSGLNLEATSDLLLLLGDRARARLALGGDQQRAAALDEYRALLQLTEQQRSALVSDDAKIALAGESQVNLRQAFQLAIQLGDARQAFAIAEQSKAVVLLDQLRRRNQRTRLDAAALAQLDAQQRADQDLEGLNRRMFLHREQPDSMAQLNALWRVAFARKTALSQQTRPLGAPAGQQIADFEQTLLARDQALLEYVCLDTVVHIFVVEHGVPTLFSQPVPPDFAARCAALDWSALAGLKNAEQEAATCQTAHQLYQWLIQPVANFLPERLVIVPDATLQSVPFETLLPNALLPGEGIKQQGSKRNFLIFNKIISYTYSASLLREMQQVEVPAGRPQQVAGLAPGFPDQLTAGSQALPAAIVAALPVLRRLPNQQELTAIGEQVCLKTYVDSAANKAQFFAACRDAVAVHVATHGILNDPEPERNFIAFHQGSGTVNAGEFLYLSELAEHDPLQLELAVFSACETARGRYLQGEGTMSMARALAAAGVRTVVTTLWPVRTTQQARLMPVFYQQMAQSGGLEKDRALALAKRDFIENSSAHPADWAGAVLIGATNVLELPATCPSERPLWPWMLLGATIGALLLYFWRRGKMSNVQ